ncbi:hypothetical protein [Phenylobacterium kunshanense]|uniref:hypothetical protein n=1 Tax=Phenylobacterium kunshanense TaxID=1445034 RepID=UPI00140379F6|nr:hypothetical protein [Phenylobacterium kunshanense]
MSSDDDMEARHGRMLVELAEAGMGVAQRLHGALSRAEGVQELVLLGEAFHTVSRSIRQTIALEHKLRHAPREPAPPKPEPARPEPARPEPARPEPARPEPARPEPARPEPARPEPARPEPAMSEPPKPPAPPPPERPERVYWNEYEPADWSERLDEVLSLGDRDAINAAIETSVARIQRGLAKAERVLSPCHPGRSEAQSRAPAGPAPPARSRTRGALLSSSSPMGPSLLDPGLRDPGLLAPRSLDDGGGGGERPRPPPWRSSG